MEYDTRDLFKIETNVNFQWTETGDLILEESVRSAAACFGIPAVSKIQEIKKRNTLSRLYRFAGKDRDIVLRAAASGGEETLETQCRIAAELRGTAILKPLRSSHGRFVYSNHGRAWMAYAYLPGEVFSGSADSLPGVAGDCIQLLVSLADCGKPVGLYCMAPSLAGWPQWLFPWLEQAAFEKKPFRDFISPATRILLKKNAAAILRLAREIASESVISEVRLTHNDLNHSNIIVHNGRASFLDVEDICYENMNIVLGHCLFKLLRHSVYEGAQSAGEIRQSFLSALLPWIPKNRFTLHGPEDFYRWGAVRILSDIQMILTRIQNPKTVFRPTDLEKKIHNLFELHCLMQIP